MAAKVKEQKQTSIVKWDEELAKQALIAAGMEANSGGGQFFSIKGGILSFDGAPMKDNQAAVVIVDHVLENVFYEDAFDPDVRAPPKCFAFGRDEKTIAPHQVVIDAGQQEHDQCDGCPQNQWGTADKGKGKACRNVRRLALLSAGTFNKAGEFERIEDEDHWKNAPVAFLKLPVTSVKLFAAFVKQVASSLRRPPHGVITKIKVVPDAKTQFKVVVEALEEVPDEIMGFIMKRHTETKGVIDFPYSLEADEPEEKPAPKKGGKSLPVVKGKPAAAAKGKSNKY